MAGLGLPLLGDMKYGSDESRTFSESRGISAPALCADRLTVKDPSDGSVRTFEAKPENPAFTIYAQEAFEK